jgi:hypothetical protein
VDIATEGYIFDALYANWGNFLTFNAAMYQNTGNDAYLINDSDHDYTTSAGDGRLVMQFYPMCIQDIMVRHIMLEFVEVGEGAENCTCSAEMGDVNGDGGWNVLDIVTLANCVLSQNCADLANGCAGDVNGDGGYNVLDIVTLANCVLSQNCGGRVDDATQSSIIIKDNMVSFEADGFIGGVQMSLTHGNDFSIEMTDRALLADYLTTGNETRLLVITPETEELFSFSGEFEIAEIIVANSQFEVSVDLPQVASFSLSKAYPNPFNPSMDIEVTLKASGDIQVTIYNLAGQLGKVYRNFKLAISHNDFCNLKFTTETK